MTTGLQNACRNYYKILCADCGAEVKTMRLLLFSAAFQLDIVNEINAENWMCSSDSFLQRFSFIVSPSFVWLHSHFNSAIGQSDWLRLDGFDTSKMSIDDPIGLPARQILLNDIDAGLMSAWQTSSPKTQSCRIGRISAANRRKRPPIEVRLLHGHGYLRKHVIAYTTDRCVFFCAAACNSV